MNQYNVHEAKSNLSQLLERVEHGEEIILARHGKPVARLVPIERRGLQPGGSSAHDPAVNHDVVGHPDWWRPMTDEEAEAWNKGRL